MIYQCFVLDIRVVKIKQYDILFEYNYTCFNLAPKPGIHKVNIKHIDNTVFFGDKAMLRACKQIQKLRDEERIEIEKRDRERL